MKKHPTLITIAVLSAALFAPNPSLAQEKKRIQAPESKTEIVKTAPAALNDYVGRYGNKEISVRDGGLHYQRTGGSGAMLREIGKDSYALKEDAKIKFIRDAKGVVIEMAIDWKEHPAERLKREPLTNPTAPGADGPVRRQVTPDQSSGTSPGIESGPQTADALDDAAMQQLRGIMTHLLETIYVSPEIGARLARQLNEKFEAGGYKQATTRAKLAEMLTTDLRSWGNDRHLYVRFDPASASDAILDLETWKKQKELMFPREQDGAMRGPRIDDKMAERLKANNYHFRQTKTLAGNVGYIEMDGFAPGEAAQQKAAETMAAVAGSDALIIDLRDCPGGAVDMINFLASYFFEAEPRVLMNRFIRPTGQRIQSKTLANIPGKRMLETDLYVLVSPRTASAGESFAYTLQQYGRAKIVGEKTAGGGYNNAVIPIGKGLAFSVSYGRPEHPRSGKGWEAEGVQPDIAVPEGNALRAAQKAALKNLLGKTTDERRKKELSSALQEMESAPPAAGPEEAVRSVEREWLDAYEKHDADAMARILADEFTISYGDGRTENKTQVLESVKAHANAGPASKFSTEEVHAQIDGDSVVLTGRLLQTSDRGGETKTMRFSYTDTYKQRDGRWQVVNSRLSRL
jgi:ketosteroid isomerase-like protein